MRVNFVLCSLLCLSAVQARQQHDDQPYATAAQASQTSSATSSLEVDLGYAIYKGVANESSGLNVFKGIRYAASTTGNNRWQAPRVPAENRTSVLPADDWGSICPQSPGSSDEIPAPDFQPFASEDCLFLNVWTPQNASQTKPLPVMVYIHGGGYGTGFTRADPTTLLNTNYNTFVVVSIQYRLGAFGFLASDEVFRRGTVNAGLLDQHLALQWVQQYIKLFSGDPKKVTVAGESAGGGSAMLHTMANGGTLGTSLFTGVIASSPYLPQQHAYNDWMPTQAYYAFAAAAGCDTTVAYGYYNSSASTIFDCLTSQEAAVLINASATISQTGAYATWVFLPVTDGSYIRQTPSQQLKSAKINGKYALVSNNAIEGSSSVPSTVSTESDVVSWLQRKFPTFSSENITNILNQYSVSDGFTGGDGALYATAGDEGPTANDQSSLATGQLQRAMNIYAEVTIVCPSYWLTEAFSKAGHGRHGYRYQFSVVPGIHGQDTAAIFEPIGTLPHGSDFSIAFQQIWGTFVKTGNPSIASSIAKGTSTDSTTGQAACGYFIDQQIGFVDTPAQAGTGLHNDFRVVDAYTWEGGRGKRCDFWRSIGSIVPE